MALGRAADFLKAEPGGNVLSIAVELPSLTFQRKDISQANLISSILFGDGAAAVVVSGKQMQGPKILETETYTFPDSLGAMGFDLRDSGFHILLAKDVPEMIGGKIGGLVQGFLDRNGRKREEIKGRILHPGGARLLGMRMSKRRQKEMTARGAAKIDEPKFSWMVLLHTAVLLGAALGVVVLRRPFILWLAAPMFSLFLAANAVRWWVIRSLGEHWNVQVVDSTRLGVVTSGPFRYVRHPNYAAVFAEMLALPLIHTAWITAAAG